MSDTRNHEQCIMCKGTGNHYHPQPMGVIGYLPCSTCGGAGVVQPISEQVKQILETLQTGGA